MGSFCLYFKTQNTFSSIFSIDFLPDLAESVMCLFLFGIAGAWLAFYKPWLNLIQGQFSFQACWGSQQAFKPIFTVTDHLERVAGKVGQQVTEYLFFQT